MNLGNKGAQYAAAAITANGTLLLVRNTLISPQTTQKVLCMPQQMSIDAIATLKAEGLLNAAVSNATRFLFLPGATVKGAPVTGNMEIEYDGDVWELLDGGMRDLDGVMIYRVLIGTRSRGIA